MQVEYKVKNKIEPFALGKIEEKGYIGHLIERQIYNRINSDFARNTIYPLCEEPFRSRPDDNMIIGLWHGEYWGKWIISACRAAKYTNDAELKEYIRKCAYNLLATADENGYIGTYKNSTDFMPCDRQKCFDALGWYSDWNWNIWCRKYTLWGLLEVYMLLSDPKILEAAEKLTTHLISELESENVRLKETGTFVGMPSCSIMKPVLILYRLTGKSEYLDFAIDIAKEWDDNTGQAPNLIRNAFSGIPVADWYDSTNGGWAKAYEMMSCFDGLIELYRLTGVKRYYDAVAANVELLLKYEQNPFFSVGFNDQFLSGANYINAASEPCDILHWYRVLYELFCISGDKKYADLMEKVGINSLLASVSYDGIWGMRIVRSHAKHQFAPPQPSPDPREHHHCCVNNLPRGLLNFAESAVMHEGNILYINQFTPVEITGEMTVNIDEGYLCGKPVSITTSGAKRVFIRVPEYCTFAKVNGKEISMEQGYFEIPADSKNSFTIEFDMNPRILKFDREMVTPVQNDVHHRRWGLSEKDVGYVSDKYMIFEDCDRVMYGPLLLARSIRLGDEDVKTVKGKHSTCSVENAEAKGNEFQLVCDVILDGVSYKMCDFASAAKVKDESAYDFIFNMYI